MPKLILLSLTLIGTKFTWAFATLHGISLSLFFPISHPATKLSPHPQLPVPGTEISIHDIENPDQTVSVGERGELWIRGPQVMSGYWQQPEETDQTLRDGWLRTGDVGYMDEEGHLFLVDRIKDLILCSGYNVYPRTIEEAINLHSAVSEVTVIGIPDDYRGEAPKAFVRLQDGMTLTETELLDFLADKLSVIERPSMIEFRAELPKTMIGKLSKKELVEEETQRTQG